MRNRNDNYNNSYRSDYRQSEQMRDDPNFRGDTWGGQMGDYDSRGEFNGSYDDQSSQSRQQQYRGGGQQYAAEGRGFGTRSYGQPYGGRGRQRDFDGDNFGGDDFVMERDRNSYGGVAGFGAGSRYGGTRRSYGNDYDNDRGFLDRAGDTISGWFDDDDDDYNRGDRNYRGRSHRGRGPKNYTRSNERLLEDASERLMHDHHVDARDIQVTADDGEVTLDGTVDSRRAKRRAEDCVHDMSGVTHVQNNLRIVDRDDRYGDRDDVKTFPNDADATNKAVPRS
ncbi:BON domain-containing protein [Altererythrobacter sp. SALINAS58]|uniref:BON domain-containing protein n=1 Tax=Alteripontixanthobacter muriae TaxID=2705546 RepID=UPI0015755A42|nr:BON domain-containing protein [Alteripontixanthobacter muriae]NTZ43406.1 BON domain-containing protein [Alteripontixanthobacter muriae]